MEAHCCTPAVTTARSESLPTHRECLIMSSEVYNDDGGNAPSGWEIIDWYLPPGRYGFAMGTYLNRDKKALVMSVRGTTSVWNIITDIGLWDRQIPPHFDAAVNRVSDMTKHNDDGEGGSDQENDDDMSLSEALSSSFGDDISIVLIQYLVFYAVLYTITIGFFSAVPGGIVLPAAFAIVGGVYATAKNMGRNAGSTPKEDKKEKGVLTVPDNVAKTTNNVARANAAEAFRRADKTLVKRFGVVQTFVTELNLRSVTFTGHSLGATVAEMLACRLRNELSPFTVQAVTFESPGCADLVELLGNYRHDNYGFIVSYLAAPHFINTCHNHLGTVRRLFVPHSSGTVMSAVGHGINSLVTSVGRLGMYGVAVAAVAAPATAPLVAQVGAAGLMAGGIGALMGDFHWTCRQHATQLLLEEFPEGEGLPTNYDEMAHWPSLEKTLFGVATSVVQRVARSARPLPDDRPGVRTIANQDLMYERRVTQPKEHYVVRSRIRGDNQRGIPWADQANGVTEGV